MTSAATSGHRAKGNSNIVLLLSLNLILLAFFILLNSLAEVQSGKARAVIASVNQAFNGRIEVASQMPAHSSSLGALPAVEAKMREIGSLFEAIVPSSEATEIRRAKAVRVDLPASALFKPASLQLRPGREALIQRLAESLRKTPPGPSTGTLPGAPNYELAVLFGVGDVPGVAAGAAGAAPEGATTGDFRTLAQRRAAILAERLVAAGVFQGALSIGLRPGPADSLRFIVRLRQEPAAGTRSQGREG